MTDDERGAACLAEITTILARYGCEIQTQTFSEHMRTGDGMVVQVRVKSAVVPIVGWTPDSQVFSVHIEGNIDLP